MLDPLARRLIDPPLDRLAAGLARLGLGADAVTVGGFVVGMGGCAALAFREYGLALGLILLNRLADGLDGAVARRTEATDAGGYLDIVLDLVFYSGVPFGFAAGRPEVALPAAFLIWSFIGTGGSFLAYAVIAAKRGLTTQRRGRKGFYYAAGLMEGTETVAFFVLFCLFPDSFAVLAWVFGGLCWLTTAARVASAVAAFRQPTGKPDASDPPTVPR
ncbi:MAG: CDP-alcohol phosphatidyltransferase family protein [Gemmataceae bacterium]|nr:CDP-alcohol phosphatidyltransferase family protein [Gemmataceae bacterium]